MPVAVSPYLASCIMDTRGPCVHCTLVLSYLGYSHLGQEPHSSPLQEMPTCGPSGRGDSCPVSWGYVPTKPKNGVPLQTGGKVITGRRRSHLTFSINQLERKSSQRLQIQRKRKIPTPMLPQLPNLCPSHSPPPSLVPGRVLQGHPRPRGGSEELTRGPVTLPSHDPVLQEGHSLPHPLLTYTRLQASVSAPKFIPSIKIQLYFLRDQPTDQGKTPGIERLKPKSAPRFWQVTSPTCTWLPPL
ncbi:hypothetical protein H1C71_003590 [Ictidomys tridecemlineatus]|nr:hypothetical protein H1C71_003590 [Ictidomys tridecemlineatus]KAG3266907.1 hypothetical protein H1C71_003590 [Ictidomys tridecemlineatus]